MLLVMAPFLAEFVPLHAECCSVDRIVGTFFIFDDNRSGIVFDVFFGLSAVHLLRSFEGAGEDGNQPLASYKGA